MADAARKRRGGVRSTAAREAVAAARASRAAAGAARTSAAVLDRVIHERVRLSLVSALAVHRSLTFVELKGLLGLTDGNLSVHARRLEEAGYVVVTKSFEGRIPQTAFQLTAAGRRALERYLDHMEALIRVTRGS